MATCGVQSMAAAAATGDGQSADYNVQPHLDVWHAQGRLGKDPQNGRRCSRRQAGMQQGLPAGGTSSWRPQGGCQQHHSCKQQQPRCTRLLHGCCKSGQRHSLAAVQQEQALGQCPQAQLLVQPAAQVEKRTACDTAT